jgi:thymidylate synthase
MNNLDRQYLNILSNIVNNGVYKDDRTSTGTISTFGAVIRHNMKEGFPLLTTKKIHFKSVVAELLWFLSGNSNIDYLLENNCNIWNGDAYKYYTKHIVKPLTEEEFVNKLKTDKRFRNIWGDTGKNYSVQWRDFNGNTDQIKNLIRDIKSNPDSRRLLVSAWNPSEINDTILPPCHIGFQIYTTLIPESTRLLYLLEKIDTIGDNNIDKLFKDYNIPEREISLSFWMRSNDFFLGNPFNLASYGLLLKIIAKEVNMIPNELVYYGVGDVHLYQPHIEAANIQLSRKGYDNLPDLFFNKKDSVFSYSVDDFEIRNYQSESTIKAKLFN